MQASIINHITHIGAKEWNLLAGDNNPFLRYEFLAALERHQCTGERYGWIPRHIVVKTDSGELIAAAPLYLKDNSYGEFVFDWAWADAYHRSGLEYYPKLVSTTPYTPVTGKRLLIRADQDYAAVASLLIDTALAHAKQEHLSSLHWLFTDNHDTQQLAKHDFMLRMGYQFHWHNHDYRDFDEFLLALSSRKRKQIKRERRQVVEAGIELKIFSGHDMSDELWHVYHRHYESTFAKLGGYATLSLPFFQEIGQTMADNVVVVFAFYHGKPVASAFCLRGADTLFGRHWGCDADFNNLHFEACYYQGIDYCIKQGLLHFEPGAQGEHKISRGFLPTATWSAHWIAHPQFRAVIDEFLQRETLGVQHYIAQLQQHSPFKQDD